MKTECTDQGAGFNLPEEYEGKTSKYKECSQPFVVAPLSEELALETKKEQFLHFVPENLEVFKYLFATRSRNPIAIWLCGLAEHVGFFRNAYGCT